jgi:hypothetical protein
MKRLLMIVLVSLFAVGCATPRVAELRLAKGEPSQASEELECMGECLDEPDGSCDDCAMRCFQVPAPTATLTFAR